MAVLYCIANVGPKIRLIASSVGLSEDKAINPKYSDKSDTLVAPHWSRNFTDR